MINGIRFLSIATSLLFIASVKADVLPGPAMPEQVSRALTEERIAPTQAAPSVITAPEETKTPGGEAAKKIKFELNGIILEGNHVYSDAQLRPIYENKLHKTITVADLFSLVQDITNYYRNNGYVISRAILPPQHVKGGVVKVRIIEGFLGKIDIGGHPKGARCIVLAFGDKIKQCPPLQIKRMEKYLLLANEIPGVDVRAVLSPSKTTTGAADLTLMTETQTVNGYLSYDNYGTRYIGPQQMTANVGLNSIFGSGDSTQITVTKTPKGQELTYVDINYGTPINAEGMRWLVGGTRAKTHPLFVLAPVDINGLNVNYYTYLNIPCIRSRTESLTFQLGFNYLDSHVTTFNEQLYTDHLRPIGANVTYNFSDKYMGANLIYLDLRQGLPIWGYTQDTNPATATTSRPGGHAVFSKMDFQLSRIQGIRNNLSLYGVVKGQWAWSALLSSEQFTFGGPQIGRGYDVAELIGDTGIAGSLELRYDWAIGKLAIQDLQPYVFYDIGGIWNSHTSPSIIKKQTGTSGGIGFRIYFTKVISGNFMWTQTFTKPVAAEELIGRGHKPRVWFSVVASL
ncbi:MAG: ShlB/FhaC/HecB family hemolysin secretion/activation protein [Gammaproteobacteria bacterium]|nr:ShlB/FhaC/HecB family hemolysin secretion/activation protein [Gammaproteobacteria bacterium]